MTTRNSGKREKQRKGRELEKDGGGSKRVSPLLQATKREREGRAYRKHSIERLSNALSLSLSSQEILG